jgi:hypothetical protein
MSSRPRRSTLSLTLLAAIGCSVAVIYGEDPAPEVVPPAPSWDDAAAATFADAGIAVPRTVMTVETDDPLDLAWIREALGFAEPLSAEERAAFEQRGGASGGDAEEERAMEDAPAASAEMLDEAPMDAEADSFGAPMDDAAPAEAEPELSRARPRSRRESQGRSAAPAPARNAEGGLAQGPGGGGSAGDKKEEGGEQPPQPVLSKLETTARVGKILIQNAEGKYESLVPRALRVLTHVEGPRARTVVDLVFQNPHDRQLQGTFYYPLPDGAAPAGFGMYAGSRQVDDAAFAEAPVLPSLPAAASARGELASAAPRQGPQTMVEDWQTLQLARVVEQKRARQVYEDVVRQNVDPALLEWSGANTFKARVFPIPAKGLKRVVLAFEQTLPRDGELLRWTFPLPGDERVGEVEALVELGEGVALLEGLQNDDGALREGEPTETGLRLRAPQGYQGAFDLALRCADARRQVIAGPAGSLDGRSFFARVVPEIPDVESTAPTGRAVFVVDTSLSEEGLRRTMSGQLLLEILERDPSIDEYAVLLFDVRARWLHRVGWRQNSAEARAETAAELEKVYLEGATNFSAALDELERQAWLDAETPATRFLLSDGLITWGLDQVDGLLARHTQALRGRWLCYRFGDVAVNRALFEALGRETRGRTVNVLTAAQLPAAAVAHRRAPVALKQVRVSGGEAADLVVAGQPKLVFPGQELEIAGRLPSGGAATLEVVLDVNGEEQVTQAALPAESSSVLAARAWAELHVRQLLALDDERLDRMVVALSQAFHLANRSASLLILESEADWQRYDLQDEQVDLSNLATLRLAEEDQRRDRLQGIALDDVPAEGKALVRLLGSHTAPATQPALPLLDRPLSGGAERLGAETAYRAARAKDKLDVAAYDAVARARALAGDTFGAIRALSCLVEQQPRSAEANRLVGYACLSLGQYEVAAELFERVRLNRPFEPQSYLEEALALEAQGRWAEAARNYEILQARQFPRHASECKVAGAYHYARLLGGRLREGDLSDEQRAAVGARLEQLQAITGPQDRTALQLTIHWNTDSTDIDLWVLEPEGERCFYQHKETSAGGKLFWDTTTGYGPELYRRKAGGRGRYDVLIHYYGNNSARWTVPTSVLLVRDRDCFGPEDGYTRRFQVRLLPSSDAVLPLRKETF